MVSCGKGSVAVDPPTTSSGPATTGGPTLKTARGGRALLVAPGESASKSMTSERPSD